MDGVVGYIVSVVVIPAVVAAAVASIGLATPLRRRAWAVEVFPAAGLALAFLVSFTNELGWTALVRRFVTVAGDDAPFERWHWLGIVAAFLMLAAPLLAFARARVPRGGAPFATQAALGLSAGLLAGFVQFPQSNVLSQLGLAGLVLASGSAVALAGGAFHWIAWGSFGVIAALAGIGGFASLAVMCGAMSVAALAFAILGALGGRLVKDAAPVESAGAPMLAAAVMLALAARCGDFYDQSRTPDFLWWMTALVPGFALFFIRPSLRAPSIGAATFWRTLGAALAGVAILGAALAIDASKPGDGGEQEDPYADMYGG
jgi:hypothetical protein